MAVSRPTCRLSALRLLVSTFGGPRGSVRDPSRFRRAQIPQDTTRFSTFRRSLPLCREPAIRELREEAEKAPAGNETNPSPSSEAHDSNSTETETEVPWFLEVEPPRHPTLMYEPAPLPEVPEGAPNLMAPLVKFVAEDLGLDELDLLDLRELDPPSALGTELFMLFGSARSERHLHVAADRLVRWLRGKGVSASADGLLGRRELKVKLRRKARKAKLLGTSGVRREMDDGISTGWICVNLGTIESSDKETETFDEQGNPAGFRVENSGATVTVQMFVDHKREEVALEKLWKGQLQRSLARKSFPVQTLEEQLRTLGPTSGSVGGSRAYSTSARRLATAADASLLIRTLRLAGPEASESDRVDSMAVIGELLADNVESKMDVLRGLRRYLATLSDKDAVAALTPEQDGRPSRIQRLFERALEKLQHQDARKWRLWLEVEAASRGVRHSELDLARLQDLVVQVRREGMDVSRAQYLGILRAIYAEAAHDCKLVRRQSEVAMEVIEAMSADGIEVLEHEVMVTVMESLIRAGAHVKEAERMLSVWEHLLTHAKLPCPSANQLIRLLDAYAARGLWDKFWAVWRMPPKFCVARTPAMYTYLFRRFAADKHQARCIHALRWCVPEMRVERPPVVAQGELLEAIKACARVADPWAEGIATSLVLNTPGDAKVAKREFVRLFRALGVGPS